ncbi:hypothetical protein ACFU99_01600 [Streptomyces sp. NPDC057654]|uniref:hypothetical protein n=1 Tax=Streptomyces sp. NPDC057654 TaxID=3346196 RepID=UPI00369C47BB
MSDDEPTLALTGLEVGTVETVTEEGAGLSLILRLSGRVNGQGPVVAQRVAIHPDNLAEFLNMVNRQARLLFPDRIPPIQ